MAETPQLYLGLESKTSETETVFNALINSLFHTSSNVFLVCNAFERLIKRNFRADPLYNKRFPDVNLWKQ